MTTREKPRDPRRLLKYLDTFFGVRNKIKGNPEEGINFTLETLTYMTSHNRADQITSMIVNKMKETGNNIPFGVFECCAGIGGNTLSFLDNPAVQWVVSYELRPERREMLKRNIAMYNLASGNRSFVPDEGFTGVPDKYKGVVLYFDPPWLPENIKGHESTKDQYILHGIKVGGKTLEQWIASCPNCAMIVARVPPGYRLDSIPGFKVETQLIKNSLVLFAIPEKASAPVTQKAVVTMQPRTLPPGVEPHEIDWYVGLRNYLFELLKMIVPSEKHRETMVSDKAMEVWVPCFTHESYNPNIGMNYEELEMVGDHAMEYNFIMYLYKTMPGITRSELSELKSHYISKAFQAQIGLRFGLDKWVRIRVDKNTHVFEDLIESFFGGVNIVGDTVFKFGAGTGLCYNLISNIFDDTKIDMNYAKGKPKTQIKETFEKLHWGKAVEHFEQNRENRTTVATVALPPNAVELLRTLGVNITNPTLAIESGTSKKVAFDNAYAKALETIRKMGITEEWVAKMRGNLDLDNQNTAPYIKPVRQKIESEGFTTFYMKKAQTTVDGKYIQLIGVRPDGTLEILAMTDGPRDEWDGKIEVLRKYLQ